MSPTLIRAGRVILLLIAVSVAFVAARKSVQAVRYFSAPVEVTGTVTAARFDAAIPLARGNPVANLLFEAVPTRLDVHLKEYPDMEFQVWLPQIPERHPKLPAAEERVTVVLPGAWEKLAAGNRVLAFGLKRGDALLVDAREYPYRAEYRTAFLAVGAAFGALVAAIGAWRLRVLKPV